MKDRKMNKQNAYVKRMVCVERRGVERELRKKNMSSRWDSNPRPLRIIGPRNIYIFKYSISILLLLEMLVEQ